MPKRRRRHGTGSIRKHGRTWWLRYYVDGQRVTENSNLEDRDAAERLLKQRVAEAAAGMIDVAPGKATIADLCKLVIADYKFRRKRDAKTVGWRYVAHVEPALGGMSANRITASHIRKYIEDRRKAGASEASINRELSIIRRGFTLAMQEDPPLVRRGPHIPKLEEDNVRQGFIERLQYERLLAELPGNLKALFVCAYHVGTRKNELRRIKWEQVDFEAGVIRLPGGQTKNKKPRTLPIYGDMEGWLRSQLANRPEGHPHVFFGQHNRPISHHLIGWREACERAGLTGLYFHDLRRSAVRNMERAGIPRSVAMSISGHRTESTYKRYDIVSEGDVQTAKEKLEAFQKQAETKLKRVK